MKGRASFSFIVKFGMLKIGLLAYNVAVEEKIEFKKIKSKQEDPPKQDVADSNNQPVEPEVKTTPKLGFNYEGTIVEFTESELKEIQGSKLDTIEIAEFVPVSEINPLIVEKYYFLSPEKAMDRQYKVLQHALEQTGKAAIGYWYTSRKDKLIAICNLSGKLVICFLFHHNELREYDPELKKMELLDEEKESAVKFVEMLSKDSFNHSEHTDYFAERVAFLSRKKLKALNIQPDKPQTPILTLQADISPIQKIQNKIKAAKAK